MVKARDDIPDLIKEVNRYTATVLNQGSIRVAEEIVKELQFLGPSWTGLYSNSWQIKVGNQSTTGTRRAGEPKPVKGPKLNVQQIRQGRSTRDTIQIEITNLARSKGYAQDTRLGRFRRGKARTKNIGQEPRTLKGKNSLDFDPTSRLKPQDYRGFTPGSGNPGGFSSQTAPLNWFQTYTEGGKLQRRVDLTLNSSTKKAKGKFLK